MRTQKLAGLLCVCYFSIWTSERASAASSEIEKEARMTTPQLITSNGYPVETHYVVTEDGYILTLHRIPGRSMGTSKKVVLLQHGLYCSSADWVVMGTSKGLGYILCDTDYDVWMGNARGNTYSKGHVEDLSKQQYWNFSFHEMGVYDLPAMIDYILQKTETQQIDFVGHSMGTTSFYVMASVKPEYNSKIRVMVSMAPVAYLSLQKNWYLRFLALFEGPGLWLVTMAGIYEMQPQSEYRTQLALSPLCSEWLVALNDCFNPALYNIGVDYTQVNKTMVPVITGHTPAGTSVFVIKHYAQIANSGKFQQIDWGAEENTKRYGQPSPPQYDLSKVTTPMALFTGDSDSLVAEDDVNRLMKSLRDVPDLNRVPYDKFDHLDFLWANDGKKLVYDGVIEFLNK